MYELPSLEVYLDLLFIINFLMDYFIFWIVSKIIYQKVSKKRLLVGSLVGASLYCLIVIVPYLRTINIIIYLILLPLIPIGIIYRPYRLKQWIHIFVVANITALIIGGLNYSIFYWVQKQNIIPYLYQATYENFSVWLLLLSILISYIMIIISRYYLQKRNTQIQQLYRLKILYDDSEVELEALLDTGNKVYDPITKFPVIIVEYKKIKDLLPDIMIDLYSEGKNMIDMVEELTNHEFSRRIRMIPYHSLGNPNGMLLGFRADGIYIDQGNKKNKLLEDVIIAIHQHDLSVEASYHALLHGDLVS